LGVHFLKGKLQKFQYFSGLIGLSVDFIALTLPTRPELNPYKDLLIIDMKTGENIKTLHIATTTKFGFVQFCGRRLAFQGYLFPGNLTFKDDVFCPGDDVTVLDMKTWEIILRVGADLGYCNIRGFLLQKDTIVFQSDCEVLSARFWI